MSSPLTCAHRARMCTTALMLMMILFATLLRGISGASPVKSCTRYDTCVCKTDTGEFVNLKLFKDVTFKAQDSLVQDTFQWNPCKGFNCATASASAACQERQSSFYDIGSVLSETYKVDATKGLYVDYVSADTVRNSRVYLQCDPAGTTPAFSATGEVGSSHYEMTMQAKEVCPVAASGGGGSGGDSNVGVILIAVFFCLLIGYFVAGVLFETFYRKRSGVEMIPNHTFWLGLPGLVKDGFFFVFGRFCRQRSGGYDEQI